MSFGVGKPANARVSRFASVVVLNGWLVVEQLVLKRVQAACVFDHIVEQAGFANAVIACGVARVFDSCKHRVFLDNGQAQGTNKQLLEHVKGQIITRNAPHVQTLDGPAKPEICKKI